MRISAIIILATLIVRAAAPASAAPLISEFMASNNSTIADQNGDYADWLEIYNPDSTPDNLGGWYLTNKADNLTKWQIPPVTLAPGAYLVVFCSSKNYTDPSQPLATNFNLPAAGGYVALVEPDGSTIASSYTFPVQYPDVSYGVTQPTNPAEIPQVGYFAAATPGAANGNYTNILLPEQVSFSVPPGVFAGSATVALGGAVGTQHIRYVSASLSPPGTPFRRRPPPPRFTPAPFRSEPRSCSAGGGASRARFAARAAGDRDVRPARQRPPPTASTPSPAICRCCFRRQRARAPAG